MSELARMKGDGTITCLEENPSILRLPMPMAWPHQRRPLLGIMLSRLTRCMDESQNISMVHNREPCINYALNQKGLHKVTCSRERKYTSFDIGI
jgi:hypothetical protein